MRFVLTLFLLIPLGLVFLSINSCTTNASSGSGPVQHVDASEAAKLLAEGNVAVLDVRTPEEFQSGHLPGAINVDYRGRDFPERVAQLDKSKAWLVYCRSGNRSSGAVGVMKKLGFTKIYHLDGGVIAWSKAKQPLRK